MSISALSACNLTGSGSGGSSGSSGSNADSSVPVTVAGLVGAEYISAGKEHACAFLTGSNIQCWGDNLRYEVSSSSSTVVSKPSKIAAFADSDVSSVSAGGGFSCASSSGNLLCWGSTTVANWASGSSTHTPYPPSNGSLSSNGVTFVEAGKWHGCAIESGEAWCFGHAYGGVLGSASPLDPNNGVITAEGAVGGPYKIANLSSPSLIAAGVYSSCALTSSGSVYCWGINSSGQLGNNYTSVTQSTTPIQVSGLGASADRIAAGDWHYCALVQSQVRCWGKNDKGQRGTDSTDKAPNLVSGLSGLTVTSIAAGGDTSCAVVNEEAAYCWGSNSSGQLGRGESPENLAYSSTPALVSGLSTGVRSIAVGSEFACAVLSSGESRCWGDDDKGQLGNGP